MWAWWGKQFHEPQCGSGHVSWVMAWTRQQGLVPYIGFFCRATLRTEVQNRLRGVSSWRTRPTHFINPLRNNDYPTSITRHLNNNKSWKLHIHSNTCLLKIPNFSEIITKEIRKAIYMEGLDIQLAHSGPSRRQYVTKKNNNTVETGTLGNCPKRDPDICQKTYTIYRLICLKCHNFYIESTIRPLHYRIKGTSTNVHPHSISI